jgi:hypothetical protein
MESLSRHLRPAPYPYGLLTLRLLGKLGGKNRQFLREPINLGMLATNDKPLYLSVHCKRNRNEDAMDDSDELPELRLPLPLRSCVNILREIAMSITADDGSDPEQEEDKYSVIEPIGFSTLWDYKIEDLDIQSYSKYVINTTRQDQAEASLRVLQAALKEIHTLASSDHMDIETNEKDLSCQNLICSGLFYACMLDATNNESSTIIKDKLLSFDRFAFSGSFASFMSEPSVLATKMGLQLLDFILGLEGSDSNRVSLLMDAIILSLCETLCACSWGRQFGLMQAIDKIMVTLGVEWSRNYEINLVNATLLAVKSQPRELSEASIRALSGFIRVCNTLYGENGNGTNIEESFLWDIISVEGNMPNRNKRNEGNKEITIKHRPCEDVFKIIVYEMTSAQQLVRYV